ncbi:MAG: RIP metalloprotease RseP [Pseudazoarcus pumilus]|nr:RIP metalloprotease RseP [Pseudazoarcus pumilus]
MNLFEYLIPFVIALGVLIFVHELGHYLVARWCGVKVLRFSVGFGRPLLKWSVGRDRTEWVLAAFPLGGYVRMLDEREGEVAAADLPRSFNRQSVWRRFAIVSAGPLANFLLAIVLYWGLFATGTEELRPRVALTAPTQTIAADAGLREGDTVLSIDGAGVRSWSDLRWMLLRAVLDGRAADLVVRGEQGGELALRLDFQGVSVDDSDEDLIARIGIRPWRPVIPPIVGQVLDDGAAAQAGVREGDRFVELDGRPVLGWSELVATVSERAGEPLSAVVERDGVRLPLSLVPEPTQIDGRTLGRIGVAAADAPALREQMFTTVRYGPLEGLTRAAVKTWDTSVLTLKMIGRMLIGEVSWKNLSGPVTIADYAGQTAKLGLAHYLGFMALISISLGVLNLLPIPVLDGGHLLYYVVEIVKGSPVSERVMQLGQQLGLVVLAMLMVFAFYNDIMRLISG